MIIIGLFCDALEFWPKMKNLLFCHSTRYLNSNYNAGSAKCSTNSLFILLKEIWRYKNGSPLTVNHKRPDIGIGKRTIQLYIKHYTETKVFGHNNSTKNPGRNSEYLFYQQSKSDFILTLTAVRVHIIYVPILVW